jgi:aryl-alcohol dehydrogenase-like predicted oxidoreductase
MTSFSKFALASSLGKGQSGLGFGCMGITAFYGASMADDKALELLQAVYNAGCRHFDTAEVYATKEKHNEDIVGQFLKTVPRDSYSVATKFFPKGEGEATDYDYATVKSSLTDSLKRLGLDHVDLYYAHRITSLEGGLEFGRTATKLKEEGLIKEVGVSEVKASWLRQIHTQACPIDALQVEWSLLTRNIEEEIVPVCKELDITIVAYSPLARNLLASPDVEVADEDWRRKHPRYSPENLALNRKIASDIQALAVKYEATAAQLSLAWLLYKANEMGVNVVPIPGSTKLLHALGNLQAVKVKVEKDDMVVLEELAARVAGARANDAYLQMTHETQK